MNLTLLGSHHTSLTATSEPELDLAIAAWQAAFERELELFRAEPEGLSSTRRDCSGTHTVRSRPHWAPSPHVPPDRLQLHFSAQKVSIEGRSVAHLCAELHEERP